MRSRALMVVLTILATVVPAGRSVHADPSVLGVRSLVFNGQGNDLAVYDGATGEKQPLITHVGADPTHGRDINAQICFQELDRDGNGVTERYFIAGEDSGQNEELGTPGWGWFQLLGDEIGELDWRQLGKLVPTWSPDAANLAENFGCGFLPDGRLITTDVGDQLPHEAASGQLIEWFPNPDGGFADATANAVTPLEPHPPWGTIDNSLDQAYCKIDTSIGTAGGSWVDDGWVYVASNRPGPNGPGGIYRYEIADFPAADSNCGGFGNQADLSDEGVVTRELWLPSDAFVLTPSALTPSGRTWNGFRTWYVSSVFTGIIAEYADTGAARVHVRNVVEPPAGAPVGQIDDFAAESGLPINDGGTPFGLGVTATGELWYADLGIQGDGPADGHGSVQRVAIDSQGLGTRATVDDGLDYPEGIGILTINTSLEQATGGYPVDTDDPDATSQSSCDDWRMYGRNLTRTFSVDDVDDGCSPINRTTASTLAQKWFVKTEKTVTASPVVADGTVFVGDWSGTMYALDADTGAEQWTYDATAAPGAAFGPIVSSAAVARVRITGTTYRTLVIFGAGPRLYALDAVDGSEVWVEDFSSEDPNNPGQIDPNTPVEIESSPVVWHGAIYVGIDNHNHENTGVRGGLLALRARDGSQLWKFEPELDHGDRGCGGVWSSPVVNPVDRLVYLATANCPDDVFQWTPHTEAVTALDAGTGAVKWSFQPHTANRKDWDFGATPNLFTDSSGRRVLGAGNKDGSYYALHPRTGQLLWRTKVADGGDVNEDFAIGGFLGSPAAHRGHVFGGTAIGGSPYYHSLDGATGSIRWRGAQAPSYAASAAVNGVVFAGSLDNVFRGYDTETGAVLFASPLAGPISSGPAIVRDAVFVGSGTSSSDACAKEFGEEINGACLELFDSVLGGLGGVHAFELATSSAPDS
ncbi:MAG TPA: PQQ-binding-like beta-propeller repeat protein [Acidimicrobiia bacterium]|nr:PQQ-binding-like beta-propeller repeat protein [Acidimicrobiia bacterium]